jgi:hypothetical protein
MKHENIQPLIIDMVDKFSIFENQSNKRFNVYKKKKYQITDITYNLDKNCSIMNKNYMYHISSKEEEESDDDTKEELLDKKEVSQVENLFNSFSLFK